MATDDESVSKHAPPMLGYLTEQMSVARMVEALEGLHFNKKLRRRPPCDRRRRAGVFDPRSQSRCR